MLHRSRRPVVTAVAVRAVFGRLLLILATAGVAPLPAPAHAETLRPVVPLRIAALPDGLDRPAITTRLDALGGPGLAGAGFTHVMLPDDLLRPRRDTGRLRADPDRFPEGLAAVSADVRQAGRVPGLRLRLTPAAGPEADEVRDALLTRLMQRGDVGLLLIDEAGADPPAARDRVTPFVRAARRVRPDAVLLYRGPAGQDALGGWPIDLFDAWQAAGPAAEDAAGFGRVRQGLDASHDSWRRSYPGRTPLPGPLRFAGLTDREAHAHLAAWCMLAAPLVLTDDPATLPDLTRQLLSSPELRALQQDPLVQPARRLEVVGDVELWARPLGDGLHTGRVAVMLLNVGERDATAAVPPAALGLDPHRPVSVRRLAGRFDPAALDHAAPPPPTVGDGRPPHPAAVPVPAHGAVLLLVAGEAVRESPWAR